MRNLIPFAFEDLGPVEFAWLALLGLGLSLLLPGRRRGRAAAWTVAIVLMVGGVRALMLPAGTPSWVRWGGPLLVVPALAAACVLAGDPRWRPRGRAAAAVPVLLGAVSLLGAPFGLDAVRHAPDWAAFLLGCFAFGALVRPESAAGRLWRRPIAGPLTVGRAAGAVLIALGAWARPFDLGWVSVLGVLFAGWVVAQVLAQGRPMQRYVGRRLGGAPVVLLVLLMISFVLVHSAKGGPFDKEKKLDPVVEELVRKKYRLDDPLPVQFAYFLFDLAWKGDLGPSFKQKDRTVNEIIAAEAATSARLGVAAIAIALLVGITAGLVSGMFRNSIFDYASMAFAMLGLALPTFIVGPMLVLVFAMKLDWFAVTGWSVFPRDLVLPAITLALPFTARIARLTRAGMLEVVHQDYIRTARAKGLSTPAIVVRHTLKGTLLPVVSFLGPGVAQLLTGSLVVEKIFGVPGLGREFVEAALNRDYGLVMGLVLVFGTLLILFNLVVDVVYAFLDPRIRHA